MCESHDTSLQLKCPSLSVRAALPIEKSPEKGTYLGAKMRDVLLCAVLLSFFAFLKHETSTVRASLSSKPAWDSSKALF
jgi:hypothetical protein